MSIVSVEPIASRASGIGDGAVRTYTIVYRVITSDRYDGPYVARTAVPYSRGDQYVFGSEYDTGSFCTDISATEESDGDGKVWLVSCQFGRMPNVDPNPLAAPYKYSWSGQSSDKPYNIDADGRPVCNTVGDVFQNQLMRQVDQPIFSITRNEASFPYIAAFYNNVVNSDYFFIFRPGIVLFTPPQTSSEYHPDYGYYFTTTYNFAVNYDGWDDLIFNMGTRQRSNRGMLKTIVLNGQPVTDPVPLTWSGDVLPQNAAPVELRFRPYKRMPFSVLGLT